MYVWSIWRMVWETHDFLITRGSSKPSMTQVLSKISPAAPKCIRRKIAMRVKFPRCPIRLACQKLRCWRKGLSLAERQVLIIKNTHRNKIAGGWNYDTPASGNMVHIDTWGGNCAKKSLVCEPMSVMRWFAFLKRVRPHASEIANDAWIITSDLIRAKVRFIQERQALFLNFQRIKRFNSLCCLRHPWSKMQWQLMYTLVRT